MLNEDTASASPMLRGLTGEPFKLGELETFSSVSIGVVNARHDPEATETTVRDASAADYLRSADTAMYSAKAMGTGIEEYDLAHSEALERMDL